MHVSATLLTTTSLLASVYAARSHPRRQALVDPAPACDLYQAGLYNTSVQLQWYFSSNDPDHSILQNHIDNVAVYQSPNVTAYDAWYMNLDAYPGREGQVKINTWDPTNPQAIESCLTADYDWYHVKGTLCDAKSAQEDSFFFRVECEACHLPGDKAANCRIKSFNNRCLTVGRDNLLIQEDCQDTKLEQLFGIIPVWAPNLEIVPGPVTTDAIVDDDFTEAASATSTATKVVETGPSDDHFTEAASATSTDTKVVETDATDEAVATPTA